MTKLKDVFDYKDPFMDGGHQIVKARTYQRPTPQWALSDRKIKELIEGSFPALRTNKIQRRSAARWATVINLYFRMGYTRSQIATEIDSTSTKVHGIIRSINRASKGLRADGGGRRACPKTAV